MNDASAVLLPRPIWRRYDPHERTRWNVQRNEELYRRMHLMRERLYRNNASLPTHGWKACRSGAHHDPSGLRGDLPHLSRFPPSHVAPPRGDLQRVRERMPRVRGVMQVFGRRRDETLCRRVCKVRRVVRAYGWNGELNILRLALGEPELERTKWTKSRIRCAE